MINDTTAGRWFRRVMWLGILANLALALPTIAAPDMMIEFTRLPTATPVLWPRFAGAAARHPQRLLHAGRHRHRSLSHRGVVRHRQPRRRRAVLRAAGGLSHAGTLRPRVPGSRSCSCCWSRSTAPPDRWRRNPRRRGPDGQWSFRGRVWRRLAFAAARRRGHGVGDPGLRALLPRGAGAVLRVRRRSFPLRIDRDRVGGRRPVLDLAGAAAGVPRSAAGARRLWLPRLPGEGRPRAADRLLEGDGRLSARRHQLRRLPRRQLSRPARTSRRRSSPPPRRIRRRRSSTSASCSPLPPTRASTPTRCSPRSRGTRGSR